jgi:nitrate reductase gamma subunit
MESLLNFVRGPLLLFAFAVFFFGIARMLALTAVEFVRAYRKAGDQAIPFSQLFRRSLGWIFPVNALRGKRIPYTVASAIFHVGMVVVPIFLAGHIYLIKKGIGIEWLSLSPAVADLLALTTLGALILLALLRILDRASRTLSGFQDWFLLVLCFLPFLTGYWVAHPTANPFPFTLTYLIHLLSAEAILVLLPFTKLAHSAMFPFTQINWELGWHFVPESGEKVRIALGKEGEPV